MRLPSAAPPDPASSITCDVASRLNSGIRDRRRSDSSEASIKRTCYLTSPRTLSNSHCRRVAGRGRLGTLNVNARDGLDLAEVARQSMPEPARTLSMRSEPLAQGPGTRASITNTTGVISRTCSSAARRRVTPARQVAPHCHRFDSAPALHQPLGRRCFTGHGCEGAASSSVSRPKRRSSPTRRRTS